MGSITKEFIAILVAGFKRKKEEAVSVEDASAHTTIISIYTVVNINISIIIIRVILSSFKT